MLPRRLQRLPVRVLEGVLAALDRLPQPARVAAAGGGGEIARAVGGEDGAVSTFGEAEQVAERQRHQLEAQLEHLGPRAAPVALRGLLELALDRLAVAPL